MEQETVKQKQNEQEVKRKIKPKTMVLAAVVLVFTLLVSFIVFIYFISPGKGGFLERISANFSYPVATIEGVNVIYSSSLKENLEAIKKFYESQDFSKIGMRVDFSTEEGKKRLKIKEREILNKAVEDKAVEILTKRRGITITKEEVDKIVSEKLEEYGTANEAEDNLQKIYGWNLEQFKLRIVMPILYVEKLEESVSDEISSDKKAQEIIGKAKDELEAGKDFSEVAREYSQGSSAQDGGEFGWIAKDQLLPEIAEKIFRADFASSNKDEIIESQLGYHIIRVEENKKEGGLDMVRIRQIFTKKNTFGDWLGEQMKEMDVNILLREYYWDKQSATVEFRDEQMRVFEKETYEDFMGDVSVMF